MTTTTFFPADPTLISGVRALENEIGHTPLYRLTRLFHRPGIEIYAKQEWMQLSGSVKARAAYNIIRHAVEKGYLNGRRTLLDATSGNTGIAYAHIAQRLRIPVALCLPENASRERKDILRSLGVNLILTSRFEGTDGAQQVARAMADEDPDRYYYADQYKNDYNWLAHYQGTAPEIFSPNCPASPTSSPVSAPPELLSEQGGGSGVRHPPLPSSPCNLTTPFMASKAGNTSRPPSFPRSMTP